MTTARRACLVRLSSIDDFADEAAAVQAILDEATAKAEVKAAASKVASSKQQTARTADIDSFVDNLNLNSEDVEYITSEADAVFDRIDANHDGSISREELRSHLAASGLSAESIERLYAMLDANSDGEISRDELREAYCRYENATLRLALGLAVVPPPRPESWDTPAEAPAEARWSLADEMFDRIDANGDGAISNRELRSYLKDTGYSLTTIDGIYDALDLNKDNEVSRTELRSAFGRYEHKTLMVALGVRALA